MGKECFVWGRQWDDMIPLLYFGVMEGFRWIEELSCWRRDRCPSWCRIWRPCCMRLFSLIQVQRFSMVVFRNRASAWTKRDSEFLKSGFLVDDCFEVKEKERGFIPPSHLRVRFILWCFGLCCDNVTSWSGANEGFLSPSSSDVWEYKSLNHTKRD